MRALAETHGVKFELARHFLARMFDSEMFSSRGQWQRLAVSAVAMAAPAALLLLDPPYLDSKFTVPSPEAVRASVIADELGLLTLLFAITGVLALLAWQSLFPSHRDYLALAGLPVRPRQVFEARFASISIFAAVLVGAMNILPSLMAPHAFTLHAQASAPASTTIAARAAASGLGCLFVFFAIVALQGLLLNALPRTAFARISTYVQGALVSALFLAGLSSWYIVDWDARAIARLPSLAWAPPVWFAGLHQAILGDADPFFAAMSKRALAAAAGAVGLAALMYLLAYSRYRKLLLEGTEGAPRRRERKWSLIRLLARTPRREAAMQFIMNVLTRSRTHRLVMMAYLGAGLAVMINAALLGRAAKNWAGGWRASLEFAVLVWPIGLSFVMLAGVRHAFSMPVEWPSNWLFRMTESEGRREWMSGVERFVAAFVIAPIHLFTLPVAAALLGWPIALRMTAFQLLVAFSAFELLFYSWQQFPFTCTYVPGKRPLVAIAGSWLASLGLLLPILSVMIAAVSRITEIFFIYLAVFVPMWLWARRRRREGWGEARLIYEDLWGAPTDLGIKDLAYRVEQAGWPAPSGSITAAEPVEWASSLPCRHPAGIRSSSGKTKGRPTAENPLHPIPGIWRRVIALFDRRRLDRDLDEELQFHLAMREQRYREEGASPADARAAARRRFGNAALVQEDLRGQWTFPGIETFLQDLRYGARQLRRSPGFTAVAAVILAVGIGAVVSVYSMCYAVLWRPVALPQPDSLAMVLGAFPGNSHLWSPASPADIADIDKAAGTVDGVASWAYAVGNIVEAGGEPARVELVRVTPNFFRVLGVQPALGRAFVPGEDQPGRDREVILSDRCWRRRFGADPHIVGKSIRLDNRDYDVAGVMPPGFAFPRVSKELWTPLALTPDQRNSRSTPMLDSIARLNPGRTLRQAGAEIDSIAQRLAQSYPETNRNRRFVVWPVHRFWTGDYNDRYSGLLLGAAMFVLLICCANVANLQFARSSRRGREVAVRTALGAGRTRIVRQFVTENLVLAGFGAAAGLAASKWALSIIKYGVPIEMRQAMPGWEDIGLHGNALALALAATAFTGILAGLGPALRSSRPDLTASLKEGGRGASSAPGRRKLRSALVALQIAMATVLLVGAGLMVRGFHAGMAAGAELEPSSILTFSLALGDKSHASPREAAEFYREALERVAGLPGARSAALATALPYSRRQMMRSFLIEARPSSGDPMVAQAQSVSADYFQTMRIPLLQGRSLNSSDGPDAQRVAAISESMARRWWHGETPIGKRIRPEGAEGWVVIAGVVGDIETSALNRTPPPTFYLPYAQAPQREMEIALRVAGPPMRLAAGVRAAVRSLDPEQPITNLNTLETLIRQESFGFAYIGALMGLFGALALTLSAVGLYGLMAYMVTERRHEIGVRMALGASRGRLLGLVFRDGLRPAAAGLIAGLAPAWGLALLMRAMLLGVETGDLATYWQIPLALMIAVLLAIYIPANRATRLDPLASLRHE